MSIRRTAGSWKTSVVIFVLFANCRLFSEEPQPPAVTAVSELAKKATWTEFSAGTNAQTSVTALVWNDAIQAALDKAGAVYLPKVAAPYYLQRPIILKSGQYLLADREAEIRLVPHTNTCMVRNEHLVGFADGPVPDTVVPDHDIRLEGGIWTTLSTGIKGANGNLAATSAASAGVPGTHGVILFQNIQGLSVRNLTVRQSAAFALHLGNVRNFLVEGIRLDRHGRDGVHVNGPASDGLIRDISGDSRDDLVSLCAWDWKNCAPSFGPIQRLTVEQVTGAPLEKHAADSIRLLPGIKQFKDGQMLACPIQDIVLRDIHDIREFKLYPQPNLELGRDRDSSMAPGDLKNITLQRLSFTRPGVIQLASNVDGLTVEDVDLSFTPDPAFKLIEIGPMSGTYRPKRDDPTTWIELFCPDSDLSVRGFSLQKVHVAGREIVPSAITGLVKIANQHLNPGYPRTTPRGGQGKVVMIP